MPRLPATGKAIAVVLALVLAAAATFAIFAYVQGIEQRAFEEAELVEVFIAQDTIPAGLSASAASEAGLIARETTPRTAVPDGAITSLEQIANLVTEDRILAGEVIVNARWVDPTQVRTAFEIPEGFEAVSVSVGIPPGIAGFVRAGDQVSLVATITEPGEAPDEEVDDEADDGPVEVQQDDEQALTRYLLQNIDVLAVGQRVSTEEGDDGIQESVDQVLLTVALEPENVERLVFAIANASLYFTLLPEDAEPQETPGRTLDSLFD